MGDQAHSLEDRLDADFAPAWRPEPGDKLVGVVVAISERTGAFGRYPIITLRGPHGGERAVHAFHSVLAQKLAEAAPKVGERLGVKYEGEREGGQTGHYHSYKVAVDRAGGGIDWSAYSDEAPALGAPPAAEPGEPPILPEHRGVHAPLDQAVSDEDIPF